jgi:uncharacterized protein YwgA
MDKIQLAMLTGWAGEQGLQGRKRLQKVVFLLKRAGCPITAEYTLHHYGPYSRDVADVCDEMVSAKLLQEQPGTQYVYTLFPETFGFIEQARQTHGPQMAAMDRFREIAVRLLNTDLWLLELGSTILYFLGAGEDWEAALAQACQFKGVSPADSDSQGALRLAREFAHPIAA